MAQGMPRVKLEDVCLPDVRETGVARELECGICMNLLDDPVQLVCREGHIFCGDCARELERCPMCQEILPVTGNRYVDGGNRAVMRMLNNLQVGHFDSLWEDEIEANSPSNSGGGIVSQPLHHLSNGHWVFLLSS